MLLKVTKKLIDTISDYFGGWFSSDVGIDLGTCTTLVSVRGKGIGGLYRILLGCSPLCLIKFNKICGYYGVGLLLGSGGFLSGFPALFDQI